MQPDPFHPVPARGRTERLRRRLRAGALRLRRNVEAVSLAATALFVMLVWALAELADEVVEGTTRDLDRDILLLLRTHGDLSDPVGSPVVEEIMRDLTALGGSRR